MNESNKDGTHLCTSRFAYNGASYGNFAFLFRTDFVRTLPRK